MKFETVKQDCRKKWLIGVCIILVIVATIMFVGTRAKYRNIERIDLVDGTINWKPYDLNVVAVKIENESGTYDNSNIVPSSGYKLSDKSYCEVSGTKDSSIPLEYKEGKVIIGITSKGTKCYLYFDKDSCNGGIACQAILAVNTIDTSRKSGKFKEPFTANTAGKIFEGPADDSGTNSTYFFAGTSPNNWVKFGKEGTSDIYWRIIRINSDGTIRMIYNGTSMTATGTGTQISNDGGTTTAYAFNTNYNDNAYVGYMYGTSGSNNYNDTHANINSSTIKEQVDKWYNTNLNKTGIKEHIDTNAGFCGDRKISTVAREDYGNLGYAEDTTVYAPTDRLADYNLVPLDNQTPSLKCSQTNDLYTVSSASRGNKALTYPVGLITSDEVSFAGEYFGLKNISFWLYTNQNYWMMSPRSFSVYAWAATVFSLTSNGYIGGDAEVNREFGVRPVINLKANTKLTGSGTTTDPYIVN